MDYSTDRSLGVSLACWCFVVYSARRFVVCLTLCHFVVFFSPFSIAIISLGRDIMLVLIIRLFDLCLFGICRFPLPLSGWEELRFVIVALPGLFPFFPSVPFSRFVPHTSFWYFGRAVRRFCHFLGNRHIYSLFSCFLFCCLLSFTSLKGIYHKISFQSYLKLGTFPF